MYVSVVFAQLLALAAGAKLLEECVISPNGDLPDPQPLLLKAATTPGILYPNTHLQKDLYGGVKMYKGDEFELACPGTTFNDNKGEVLTATCVKGTTVKVGKNNYNLKSLKCKKAPEPIARWTTDYCAGGKHKYVEIGYEIEKKFLSLIRVCFDDDQKIALYSVHVEDKSIYSYERSYPRVDFESGDFYKGVIKNVNSAYSIFKQREQIAKILGSKALGEKYVGGTGNGLFLARGHLSAKADFVYGAEQTATFFYVNVVGQWQVFNAGNWAALEDSVRTFVSSYGDDVTVYTGTYGVATLPDVNGDEKEIYLYTDKNNNDLLPVPKLMYKLLYSESKKAGVVFLGVNNPYLNEISDDYKICKNVCEEISWLTWRPDNYKKGYSYCCEVNDFLQTVKTLPKLDVTSLLK